MRFFRASSRSPSSGSSRQCLDPVKNDCIYHQSRRLPSCTGGRPPVQECAGSHRRYWPTRMRAIGLPGQRGAASKVASNVGASTASWAQACTRLPATAAGCNGMLPASDSLSAARWADAGAPFRARDPRSLEIVDCEQLAKRQRVDKLILRLHKTWKMQRRLALALAQG